MSILKSFKAPVALSAILLVTAGGLTACSGDSDEGATAQAPAANNTMDVKQPEPKAEVKEPLVAAPAPAEVVEKVEEKAAEVTEAATEAVTEVKEAVEEKVAAVTAPSGESAYSTCVGCHGASGEGGVGPRLNNQTVDDIVTKLEKYKAGEQLGPMTAMMAPMAQPLSTEDMKAIAEYITAK